MTRSTSTPGPDLAARLRAWRPGRPGFLAPPPQGVSAVFAFVLLMGVVGSGVADARRTIEPGSGETDHIAWLMVMGAVVGYVLARSSLPLVGAHVIGAVVGTAAMLAGLSAALGGGEVLVWPDAGEVTRRMALVWDDLLRLARPESGTVGPRPWGFAMLVLGALCWATAQFGAMSIFRHGRAVPAIAASGLLLFLDILVPSAYAGIDAVVVAVAFATLGLFLLVRLHLAHQQSGWARRSVVEGADVARVFMGAGAAFVAVVIVATASLTTVAIAERGTIPWQSLARPFESVREQLLRVLEGLGVSIPPERPAASLFSSRQDIPDRWDLGTGEAFTAVTDVGGDPYWFGAAFETFTRNGYRFEDVTRTTIEDGAVDHGNLEIPPGRGAARRETVTTTITPDGDGHYTLLGPATVTGVSETVRGTVVQHTPGGVRVGVELQPTSSLAGAYEVASSELSFGLAGGALAADDLRTSGRDYPAGLRPFLEVPEALIGPETTDFIARVERRNRGARANPYDIALDVQDTLRSPPFRYETDMRGVCGDRSASECLLAERVGFCSYYATTMAIVLRELGIPTRLVHGYLPGVSEGPGRWSVPMQAAHAWVEVWFAGAGWVRFDPTPGLEEFGGAGTRIPEGAEAATGPDRTLGPGEPSPSPEAPEPSPSPEPSVPPVTDSGGSGGGSDILAILSLGIAALVGGLALLGGVGLFLVRRLPAGDPTLAYRGVVRLASRLGHGPAPSQTEYEYVEALGEALPSVARELQLVAHVRVEAVYGRRTTNEAIAGLGRAYARVRTALLRLLVRR